MAESLGSGDVPKVCRICLSKGSDIEFSSLATEPTKEVFIRSTHLYVSFLFIVQFGVQLKTHGETIPSTSNHLEMFMSTHYFSLTHIGP